MHSRTYNREPAALLTLSVFWLASFHNKQTHAHTCTQTRAAFALALVFVAALPLRAQVTNATSYFRPIKLVFSSSLACELRPLASSPLANLIWISRESLTVAHTSDVLPSHQLNVVSSFYYCISKANKYSSSKLELGTASES